MKKNNKAFTLIELLAIIVILAIIAVITVPIILNIIENSRKGAAIDSAYGYKDAIEKYYVTELSGNSNFEMNGDYTIGEDGKLFGDKTHEISFSGKIPSNGSLTIEKNIVKNACLVIDEYKIELQDGKFTTSGKGSCDGTTTPGEPTTYKVYKNGGVVYFDVKLGTSCTNYVEANSEDKYKGTENPTETNNNCLKFYAFNDSEESDRVNLLLDHNTTIELAWNLSGDNLLGPSYAFLNQLKTDTNGWTGVTELTTNDTYTPSKMYNNADPYTINYNGYRARIISAEEVAQITRNDSWTIGDLKFYFDSNTSTPSDTCKNGNTSGCKYGWLYDRMYQCTDVGCYNNSTSYIPGGYWTSSAKSDGSHMAWCVDRDGSLSSSYYVDTGVSEDLCGLRPVITVSKSLLPQE